MPWPELWGRFRILARSKGDDTMVDSHESEQRWRAAKQRTANFVRQRGAH